MSMLEMLDSIGKDRLICCEGGRRTPASMGPRCDYRGALRTFPLCASPYFAVRCPNCGSTANVYNSIHAAFMKAQTKEVERTKRSRVLYLSGPYTAPDPVVNTRAACLVALELEAKGWLVIIPHTSLLRHMIEPMPYEYWMGIDMTLVGLCGAWTRFSPEVSSPGTDRELAEARRLGLTVFPSYDLVPQLEPR